MKTILKLVVAFAIFAMCNSVSAQDLKLAHINIDELIESMPENDSVMSAIRKKELELMNELELLQVEYNRNLEEYRQNYANWDDLVRLSREERLSTMLERVQGFQQSVRDRLQQEYIRLMQPVIEKANKAIDAVAKEKGLAYVLNTQALHYIAPGTLDLLPVVRQHLGIKD